MISESVWPVVYSQMYTLVRSICEALYQLNRLNQMLDPKAVQSQISALEQKLRDEQTQRQRSSAENLKLHQQIEKRQWQFAEFQQAQKSSQSISPAPTRPVPQQARINPPLTKPPLAYINRLKARNPLDWFRLLYWVLLYPAQLVKHREGSWRQHFIMKAISLRWLCC